MNDNNRTGANLNETTLNTSNVNVNQFGKLWSYSLDGATYAQSLYMSGVSIAGGTHNVVYIETMQDSVYAFDADSNTQFWHDSFVGGSITPVPITDVTGNNNLNIVGNVGIESTPVIDPTTGTIYVLARTKDTSNSTYFQKLHALDITTGAEKFGGPVTISTSGFDNLKQNQRASLALVNGKVIIAWSSHEDIQPYHGWVMAYNANNLVQSSVFSTTPSGNQAAVWQSGRAPAIDGSGNIYFISGNGTWDGNNNFGESFLKLSTSGSLTRVDWFTPDNYGALNSADEDLGAAGAMLIPGTSLVIGGGKQGTCYVCNTGNMGHEQSGNGQIVQHFTMSSGQLRGGTVYWNSPDHGPVIYDWGSGDHLKAFHFNGSTIDTTPLSQSSASSPGLPGAFLSVSANGSTAGSGIVWATLGTADNDHGTVSGIVRAFDASNVGTELWNSSQNSSRDGMGNFVKDANPTIANGKVYIGSYSSKVTVYGLLNANPDFTISASPASQSVTPGANTSYTVTVTAQNGFNGTVNLTASGLPSGASASFNPSTITGSGTSSMMVTTSSSTPTGTSTLTITGTSGSLNHSTTVSLVVQNASQGAQPMSINFVGNGTAMGASESAGVVVDSNWNNAVGPTGSGQTLNDDQGAVTTSTLTWSANHNSSEGITDTPGNNRMMNGYVNTSSSSVTTVSVASLPASANGWTVYVYCEENTGGATRVAAYQISGTGISTTTINATDPNTFNGTFTQANNSTGNYVAFTIGNVAGFTITATPVSSTDANKRAPINGIQIIPVASGSPPPAPTNLSATAGNTQVSLTWSTSSGATSYNVKRATTSGGPYTTIATGVTSTSYTDTGLSNGTTYYYVVTAVNGNGESGNSNEASATPSVPAVNPISINFGGTNATSMGSSETAGVVPESNWNNALGLSGNNVALNDSTGAASGATVTWNDPKSATATGITDTAGNNRMMKYYLDSSTNTTTTVTVSGLAPNANGYKVYVYFDGNNAETREGAYTISGTGITTTTINGFDNANVNFSGTFTLANNSAGNYVLFTIGNVSGFTVKAMAVNNGAQFPRGPLNGMQVVPQ